jgi:predicted negative regulator of RcsB-dependent stress response
MPRFQFQFRESVLCIVIINFGLITQSASSDSANTGTSSPRQQIIRAARDTWSIEQLQRQHIDSLLKSDQPDQALVAAKALFLVSGIGSTQYCIHKLAECFKAANPRDSAIVSTFKLQQLALASSDPALRAKQSKDLGENVLAAIPIDPKPFEKAIDALAGKKDYNSLYAKGNLLLLSGRVPEARQAFEAAYKAAPPGELKYATEGLMKVIKAEDLSIGRMNQTILELRPKE